MSTSLAEGPAALPGRRWRWPLPGELAAALSLAVVLLFIAAAVQPAWLAPGDPLAADRAAVL
ncbi:MAG: hypothetical protein QM586_02115, partial [Xenophilus sp.]